MAMIANIPHKERDGRACAVQWTRPVLCAGFLVLQPKLGQPVLQGGAVPPPLPPVEVQELWRVREGGSGMVDNEKEWVVFLLPQVLGPAAPDQRAATVSCVWIVSPSRDPILTPPVQDSLLLHGLYAVHVLVRQRAANLRQGGCGCAKRG